jgi:hypothetical protein
MSADECPHGLHPTWCSICLHGISKAQPPATIEATFRAKFDGQCQPCNLPIVVGQVIHKLSTGAYVHDGCQP